MTYMKELIVLQLVFLSLLNFPCYAVSYFLDEEQGSLIGAIQTTETRYEDTLLDVARLHGLGYHDIKLINPTIDTWLPGEGKQITLPSHYILPDTRRRGIVLNIPEMRLYYFHKQEEDDKLKVITYPLGIGREGWDTPYVKTKIIQKQKDPYWFPPKSIREEHAEAGDPLPRRVGPGPENPLGRYALRLGLPQYLIHGTNKPYGIGMRVSHGCIRLYPEDIEQLFSQIELNTPVNIINQPYKLGFEGERIFLEAHPFLQEDAELFQGSLTSMVRILVNLTEGRDYELDWDKAKQVIHDMEGVPIEIGRFTIKQIETNVNAQNISGIDLRLETHLDK